ncbi:methyl-accepting chemotaxis sensory transducer with TarH sensor [Paraburkholderia caballeronis]|uniref:methyl-accepting chemotaxis protein n=1 Tax=Paraburkholderia caballeronis TaxID=416943 RepID=UPI00106633D1|nr:methyl-accepting chemotaxis protein [Paraburkholderia caballeronis]TDV27970.1 methyl-accepting chemotaxis sensory transducer with TarH sensor [Paraburkholderia caballeronis]
MLHKWSIRTTLTSAGIIQLALAIVVGVLAVIALSRAHDALAEISEGDLVATQALSDASSMLLRSRVALERVSALTAAGNTDEANKALSRADELLGKGNDAWKTFQSMPKQAVDAAMLDSLVAKHDALMHDGVEPEFAALRANDVNAYHAIADTKISPMFVAYDNVAAPVAQALREHAKSSETDAQSQIALMRTLIIAAIVVALILLVVIRFALRGLIVQPLDQAAACFERIAGGDLTQSVEVRGNNEIGRLFGAVRRTQESIAGLVNAVHSGAESIDVGAHEIAMGNTDLSQRTEEQAASLQETATSMDHLTGTVRQNAENARQASQLAVNASDIATRGGSVVGEVVHTMQDIAASSSKIVDIISVIEGIAFQTNILALNAAVEAARAGEQGRGFAVVAGEVRSLAQRSAGAAKEIKELINDSAEKVQSGSQLVGRAGATMDEILQAVRRVTDIMGEISAASEEQSGGIEQVNRAITQMDTVTQQNAALVEEAAAAAASLEEQTSQLKAVMGRWRTGGAQGRAEPARAAALPSAAPKAVVKRAPPPAVTHAAPAHGSAAAPQASSAHAAASTSASSSASSSATAAAQPGQQTQAAKPAATVKPAATAKPAARATATKPGGAPREPALASTSGTSDSDWETF